MEAYTMETPRQALADDRCSGCGSGNLRTSEAPRSRYDTLDVVCPACGGTGIEDDAACPNPFETEPIPCDACKGRGTVEVAR